MKPPLQQFLAQALKDFETHLKKQGDQPATIAHRLRGAEQFARFLLGTLTQKGEKSKGSV